MRRTVIAISAGLVAIPALCFAAEGEISVERGLYVSITHGCHDCHTANYPESEGKLDPAAALKGTTIGWRGPWGTTYPANLRIIAAGKTEDEFVDYGRNLKTRPPMPYFNVNIIIESDLRSLYRYIRSLGDPGDAVPEAVPPNEEPKTPYYPIVPPTMPKM